MIRYMPKAPEAQQLKNEFASWSDQLVLNKQQIEDLMLVKGVLLNSGKTKMGWTYSVENTYKAGGSLRGAAYAGIADIDIDHIANGADIPNEYIKEFGEAIRQPYPVGKVIDAEVVKNSDGSVSIEAIMSLDNPLAYKMVKEGRFIGNSLVDIPRKNCSKEAGCVLEGSTFVRNTLILKSTPNSHGTWIAPVSEEDVGTIIKPVNNAVSPVMTILLKKLEDIENARNGGGDDNNNNNNKAAEEKKVNSVTPKTVNNGITDYLDEQGSWREGADGIRNFLVANKSIPMDTAADMAQWLYSNPGVLNNDQLTNLSTVDLQAWWNRSARLNSLENKLDRILQQMVGDKDAVKNEGDCDCKKDGNEKKDEEEDNDSGEEGKKEGEDEKADSGTTEEGSDDKDGEEEKEGEGEGEDKVENSKPKTKLKSVSVKNNTTTATKQTSAKNSTLIEGLKIRMNALVTEYNNLPAANPFDRRAVMEQSQHKVQIRNDLQNLQYTIRNDYGVSYDVMHKLRF